MIKILEHEQGTPEWFEDRLAMLTGSKFKRAVGDSTTRKGLIAELIGEELTGIPANKSFKSESMARGNIAEPFAREEVFRRIGRRYREVPMFISDKYPKLGFSSDGYEGDGWTSSMEIKSVDTSTVLKYSWKTGKLEDIPAEYRPQFYVEFIANQELKDKIFVLYDPRIKVERLQLQILTITREQAAPIIEEYEMKLKRFLKEWEEARDKFIPKI